MLQRIYIIFYLMGALLSQGQNPVSIDIPISYPNPQNLSVDTYTRATTSVKLQTGFKYGFVNGGATNLLNLSIGTLPTFFNPQVNANYLGSGLNPSQNVNCSSFSIDGSKPVGETKGAFAVSPNGAALYSIPIFVSPGTANMEPRLSIEYNSQGNMGQLGQSWYLKGLSSIRRVGKTPFQDGKFDNVSLTLNDVYELDNNHLYALSGSYGGNGTTYYQEHENFSTITSFGTSGNGPQYFIVKDKEGNTYEYGNNLNARLSGLNDNTVLTWFITKAIDEYGNFINYNYTNLNGEVVIDKIEYTGNSINNIAPYNKILFNYMLTADRNTYYINGKEFKYSQILKSIVVNAENSFVKQYNFDYSWDKESHLSKITEIDATGNELNPTTFCWKEAGPNYKDMSKSLFTNNDYEYDFLTTYIPADLNGDGGDDNVCFFDLPYAGLGNSYYKILSNSNVYNTDYIDKGNFPFPVNQKEKFVNASVADENFDNKQEVYMITAIGTAVDLFNAPGFDNHYYVDKIVSVGNGYSITRNAYTTISNYNFSDIKRPPQVYFNKRDFTNDGINDELLIDPEKIVLSGVQCNFSYNFTSLGEYAKAIQFDSDAEAEYMIFSTSLTATTIKILDLNISSSQLSVVYTKLIPYLVNPSYNDVLNKFDVGDFNNDNIDDICYILDNRSKVYVMYGNGNSFLTAKEITVFNPLPLNDNCNLNARDINNDGFDDITINIGGSKNYYSSSYKTSWYFTYFSNGEVFIKGGELFDDKSNFAESIIADIDGDGSQDFGLTTIPTIPKTIPIREELIRKINGKRDFVVEKIKTGHGSSVDINYFNLPEEYNHTTDNTNVYNDVLSYYNKNGGNYTSVDLYNYKMDIFCVSKVKLSNFQSTQNINLRYTYSDAFFHNKGNGFLGFETVNKYEVPDEPAGGFQYPTYEWRTSVDKYDFNNTKKERLLIQEIAGKFISSNPLNDNYYDLIGLGNNGIKYTMNKYTYNFYPKNSKGLFVVPDKITEKDYLNSTEKNTQFTYDSNNGKLGAKSITLGWESNVTSSASENYNYTLNNGNYKVQSMIYNRYQIGNSNTYNRNVNYSYDSQGHLTQKINDASYGLNSVITTYSNFNLFGMPETELVNSGSLSSGRTFTKLYDNYGRFIIKTINAINDAEEMQYEPKFGKIIQHKDISGLITKYSYDGLGRAIKTELPNGVINTLTYQFETISGFTYPSSASSIGVFSALSQDQGKPYRKIYLDAEAHVLRTELEGFQSATIIKDTKYNYNFNANLLPSGIIKEETEPFYLGQATYLKQQYEYEPIAYRIAKQKTIVVNPTSLSPQLFKQYTYTAPSVDFGYNKAKVTITDHLGKQLTKEFNNAGQTDVVKNNRQGINQTANYLFNNIGAVSQMNLAGTANAQINYNYNQIGLQTQLIDPCAGTIDYEYNAIGELTKQTTPGLGNNAKVYTYTYDNIGRLISKVGSTSGTTSYQYETSNNGKGKLKKVIGANTAVTDLTYDYLGRLTEQKESIGVKNMSTKFTYDLVGNVINYEYPNGFNVNYNYDSKSYLQNIKSATNQLIWQLNAVNAVGMVTQYAYGNGITTQKQFSDLHYLKSINHGVLHNQVYDFNESTGNLNSRVFSNLVNNITLKEKFTFDGAERLTNAEQVNYTTNATIQMNQLNYSTIGNITHKDDAGDYVYTNPTKPFELTRLTNSSPDISLLTLSVDYNDLRKPSRIAESVSNKEMLLEYGNDESRIKMEYKLNGINQYTRYYSDNYDRQETATGFKEWNYIYAPSGLCAIQYNNNGSSQLLYAQTDHLGSPVVLTDAAPIPSIVEENSFDAWGRRRNPSNWTYALGVATPYLIRGYTMHEQLDEFKLINMNARLYDPILGRFIQPDNEIQDPDNLQNINRYSYALNNPLRYTDPSGNEYEDIDDIDDYGRMDKDPWEQDEGQNGYIKYDQTEGYSENYGVSLQSVDVTASLLIHEESTEVENKGDTNPNGTNGSITKPNAITLVNKTKAIIWIKPENNKLSPVSVLPGKSTTIRIDGVTHPSYPGQVFKVKSFLDLFFGVEANVNGIVVGANSVFWPLPAELNYSLGGGWLTSPPNDGWKEIFIKAGYTNP
jgi:RHS repeat-associated protein